MAKVSIKVAAYRRCGVRHGSCLLLRRNAGALKALQRCTGQPAAAERSPLVYIALEQPTGAHLLTPDHDELAVPVTLRYLSDDPLAVHLVFPAWISLDEEEVTWTFARSLLEEGLGTPA